MKNHQALVITLIGIFTLNTTVYSTPIALDSLNQKEQPTQMVKLRKGTVIQLKFSEPVNSGEVEKGEVIHLEVYGDIVINGNIVIPTATFVEGQITKVRRRGLFGRGGVLKIQPNYLKTVDHQHISLRGEAATERGKDKQLLAVGASAAPFVIAAAAGAPMITLPVVLVSGVFVKGGEAKIEKGRVVRAMIAEDVFVKV